MNIKRVLKSLFQAGAYLVDQPERAVEGAGDSVKSGISHLRDQLQGDDRTLYYALAFAAGVGVGIAVGILTAPDSGEKTRRAVVSKVSEVTEELKHRGPGEPDVATGT
jgi:hypothetical protein